MAFEPSAHPLVRHIEAGIQDMNTEARTSGKPRSHRLIYAVVPRQEAPDESDRYRRRQSAEAPLPGDVLIPLDRQASEQIRGRVQSRLQDPSEPLVDAARWLIDDVRSGRMARHELDAAHDAHIRTLKKTLGGIHQSAEPQQAEAQAAQPARQGLLKTVLSWLSAKEQGQGAVRTPHRVKVMKRQSLEAALRMLEAKPLPDDLRKLAAHLSEAMKAQGTPGHVAPIFHDLRGRGKPGKMLILRFTPVTE